MQKFGAARAHGTKQNLLILAFGECNHSNLAGEQLLQEFGGLYCLVGVEVEVSTIAMHDLAAAICGPK